MFSLRIAGTVIKATTLVVLEVIGFGMWLIWRGALVRNLTLKTFLTYAICTLICILIYYIDTERYVYVVEDDN